MRRIATGLLMLSSVSVIASPATDRCLGDRECIAGVKAAAKADAAAAKTKPPTTDEERKASELYDLKMFVRADDLGMPGREKIVTEEQWEAFFATAEGLERLELARPRKIIAEKVKAKQQAASARAYNPYSYESSCTLQTRTVGSPGNETITSTMNCR